MNFKRRNCANSKGDRIMETKYGECPKCEGIPIGLAIERKFKSSFLNSVERNICEFVLSIIIKSNFNTTCTNCGHVWT